MSTTTRDRTDEILELEALWAAPAVAEPQAATERRPRLPLVPGAYLTIGWVAFFVLVGVLAPAPEPGMTWAPWAVGVELGMFGLLLLAAGLGLLLQDKAGFAAAMLAGPLLMALAVNCRAAEHHMGNWWLAELGAATALTGLAAVGLRQRLRGE